MSESKYMDRIKELKVSIGDKQRELERLKADGSESELESMKRIVKAYEKQERGFWIGYLVGIAISIAIFIAYSVGGEYSLGMEIFIVFLMFGIPAAMGFIIGEGLFNKYSETSSETNSFEKEIKEAESAIEEMKSELNGLYEKLGEELEKNAQK